jgi:NAD(P)-dependent dehydrogenase (short-subunit alcohol dehydrogenase family)
MRVGLDGRAVIVTGAASGIGMAIAAEAAASGAALLLTDHARVSYSLGARTSR